MTTGKPWKLYAAHPGQPRLLLESCDTLSEATLAFRDVTGINSETLRFSVTINLARKDKRTTARFEGVTPTASYLIEFEE